jgi:hypothetical protein
MKERRRFCARWRREFPTQRYGQDYLMLDADGPGRLVGFVYGVRLIDNVDRWSHGGADNIYIDGQGDHPAYLRGIGGEDTFGASYGGSLHTPRTHLNAGIPYYEQIDDGTARPSKNITGYRWFLNDAILFEESIQVRFGSMENDICSTVYWYQEGSVRPFFKLPSFPALTANRDDNPSPRGTYDLPIPASGTWRLLGRLLDYKDHRVIMPSDQSLSEATRTEPENVKTVAAQHGFVDFGHVWRPRQRGVGVHHRGLVGIARALLRVEEPLQATIRLAWDDHLVLRLNDDTNIDFGNRANFGSQTRKVLLKKGKNLIEIRLSNTQGFNHGGWAFAFQAVDPSGSVLFPMAE